MKRRILVPYTLAFPGGVRRVLGFGLPLLARYSPVYAELACNDTDMEEMRSAGVSTARDLGCPGAAVVSARGGLGRFVDYLRAAPKLARTVLRLRSALPSYDIVYVHGVRELLLAFVACSLLSHERRPSVVWHCHALLSGHKHRLASWLAQRCAAVIAVSHNIAETLRRSGISTSLVHVVYNAVPDRSGVVPSHPVDDSFVLLVATAALRNNKGIRTAVQALAILPPRYSLEVTGDVTDPVARNCLAELRATSEALGVVSRVRFVGFARDVERLMLSARAVLVPSLCEEAFGLTAAESMRLGVPVVVSDRGALPEVVDHGSAGLVFAAGDARSLAEQVLRLEDDTFRAHVTRAGVERARSLFSYGRWAADVQRILDAVT